MLQTDRHHVTGGQHRKLGVFRLPSLTGMTLPDSLKAGRQSLGYSAELSLSTDHPRFALVDGMLIDKGEKCEVLSLWQQCRNLAVPEGILQIGDRRFTIVTA